MDTSLQKEFEAKIHSLLKEELSYHTLEYQKKIKSQILGAFLDPHQAT